MHSEFDANHALSQGTRATIGRTFHLPAPKRVVKKPSLLARILAFFTI